MQWYGATVRLDVHGWYGGNPDFSKLTLWVGYTRVHDQRDSKIEQSHGLRAEKIWVEGVYTRSGFKLWENEVALMGHLGIGLFIGDINDMCGLLCNCTPI